MKQGPASQVFEREREAVYNVGSKLMTLTTKPTRLQASYCACVSKVSYVYSLNVRINPRESPDPIRANPSFPDISTSGLHRAFLRLILPKEDRMASGVWSTSDPWWSLEGQNYHPSTHAGDASLCRKGCIHRRRSANSGSPVVCIPIIIYLAHSVT